MEWASKGMGKGIDTHDIVGIPVVRQQKFLNLTNKSIDVLALLLRTSPPAIAKHRTGEHFQPHVGERSQGIDLLKSNKPLSRHVVPPLWSQWNLSSFKSQSHTHKSFGIPSSPHL